MIREWPPSTGTRASAVGVPALHTGGDVGVAVELAAVEVVDLNGVAGLLCSCVDALDVAVAVADDGGDGDAAQEAQLGEAVFGDGIACQVACLLLLEGDAVAVGGDGVGADIGLGHIDGDEADVGVLLSSPGQGCAVQVAHADNGVGAVADGTADHGLALLIGSVGLGDVVLAVFAQVVLDGSPACLVEALVVDGAGVAAQGHIRDGGALSGLGSCAGSSRRSSGAGCGAGRTAAGGQNRSSSGCAHHSHEVTTRNHMHKNTLLFTLVCNHL